MTTNEIRAAFLAYFEKQGHLAIPSASLIPFEDDPSVLLTIAGMQPLKSYFLGADSPPARRMTSSQKCFRTNDIDQVGHTARHLTFFEMLGNFSIGDYFKDDAIRFGWEVSTEVFGLDPDKIWITVFEGMEGVPGDDEALERWVEMGVPRERIQRLGEADNFWKAGPTGPCGPNTELYLDRGPEFGPEGGPVTGGDRYLEYWNLVFMQYDRAADGSLSPLPAKNIDTGAGLERMAAILQDVPSVFETDGFRPLITWAENASGRRYGADPRDDRAFRVLADHGRAMTFLAADGVRPGNEGRDYVLRRIIRRAVSEAGHLGLEPAAVAELASPVEDGWGDAYPELRERSADVRDTIGAEAEQFARTLTQGRRLLGEVIDRSRADGTVSGDDAFRLHDTYGFPLDLTLEAAHDAGLAVDADGFERLMEDQRERSRAGAGHAAGASEVADRAASLARDDRDQRVRRLGRRACPDEGNGVGRPRRRHRPAQAGELALLPGGRRPGVRHRRDRRRRGSRVGHRRLPPRLGPGAARPAGGGRARRGQRGDGLGGRRPPAPDPGQPHRHPRPQLGPQGPARPGRAPGRLLRGPRQAALRLHPPRPRRARDAGADRGDGQRAAWPRTSRSSGRSWAARRPPSAGRWACSRRSTASACAW